MVLVGALLVANGCMSEASPPEAMGGSPPDPPRYGDPDQCGRCVEEQCVTAFNACATEPECSAYIGCVFACPIDAEGGPEAECVARCKAPTATAAVAAQAELAECTAGQLVRTACPACPGAFPAPSHPCFVHECPEPEPDPAANSCVMCSRRQCCDVRYAYENNSEAFAIAGCYDICEKNQPDDLSCRVECNQEHPDGVADYAAMFTCAMFYCFPECAQEQPSACRTCSSRACDVQLGDDMCSLDGWLLNDCVLGCNNDLDCELACFSQHPDGTATAEAHYECVVEMCGDVC